MSTHNYRISNLRAIAILTVMLGHSMIIYSNNWNLLATDVASPLFCFIKESIIDLYQMPLFFVISGYLFHNTLMRDWNFEHFLLKKFRRLMVPYFMVALFWLIPIRYIIGYYKISDIPHVMHTIVIGTSNSHLWFIAALFLIFIVFYLFFGILGKYRTDNRTIGITLLALFFAIKLLPTTDNLFLHVNQAWWYSGWFMLGVTLRSLEVCRDTVTKIIIVPLMIIVSRLVYGTCGVVIMLLTSLFILYSPNKSTKFLSSVDTNCMGLYLLHSPLCWIVFSSFPNANPWLIVMTNFLLMGCLAFIISNYLSKSRASFVVGL